ncbi:MAG: hypothetical protein JNM18_09055 [Planctomycetaceae bacterium]|nr:hypothetical protein [Planctomycetaceae bacterium]
MKMLCDEWLLLVVLALLAVIGAVLVARSTLAEIEANLGIELLGTVVSVLLIDFAVTRYIERKEQLRRRPILRTIGEQLQVLVDRIRGEFAYIGIDLGRPVNSAQVLGEHLDPDRFNARIEKVPGHYISHLLAFTSENSFSRQFLRELYELTRADLPPELASAILAVVGRDNWAWQPIVASETVVDRNWIDERKEFLFEYLVMVKRLDSELKQLRANVV